MQLDIAGFPGKVVNIFAMIEDKFALMFRTAREDVGRSQEYMAKSLGVSKRTIQNWESGYSSPSQVMAFKWFEALSIPPLPYYLSILYKDFDGLTHKSDDDRIEAALIGLVKDLTPAQKRKLLYILYGDHGSSTSGMIELTVAHLHTPLEMRLNVVQNILTNYEIASAHNHTSDHIKPDIEMIERCAKYGKQAIIKKDQSYTNMKGDLS